MDPWLPLLAGLVGTVIGGAIAYVNASVQWRRQQRAERNRFLTAKLEELAKLVIEVHSGLKQTWAETMGRINGWPPPKDSEKLSKPIPLEQMELLVELYFPALSTPAKAVIAARDRLGKYVAQSISRSPEKAERQKLSTDAAAAYEGVEAAYNAFLKEAARVASSLA